jgi:hypothetical protein
MSRMLEHLNYCVTRKMKIRRNFAGRKEEKIVSIDLHSSWKTRTKGTFERESDKQVEEADQDAVFDRECEFLTCE